MNAHMEYATQAAHWFRQRRLLYFFRPNLRSGIQSGTCLASLRHTALPERHETCREIKAAQERAAIQKVRVE